MKIKTLFLQSLIFLPGLNVFAVNISASEPQIMQTKKPSWFEKVISIKHNQDKKAIKDAHYKWHMSLNRSDLNIPTNAKSLQIIGLNFNFKLEFNVFEVWHDSGLITLNTDQLIKATTLIQNKHALNMWVEGLNNFIFGGLKIKSGIEEISSAYFEKSYSYGANWYTIYDFSTSVSYKYLIDDNDNNDRDRVINYVSNFFKKEHDFNFSTLHRGIDVLQRIKEEFKKSLPRRLLDALEVNIINRSIYEYNHPNQDNWDVKVIFYQELINSKTDDQNAYFSIKLKNIYHVDQKGQNIFNIFIDRQWELFAPEGYEFNWDLHNYKLMSNYQKIFKETLAIYLSSELLATFEAIFTIHLVAREHKDSMAIDIYLKEVNIYVGRVIVKARD